MVLAIDKRKSRPHPLHLSDGARAPPTPQTHTHTHAPRCARAASPVCRPTPCSSLPQVAEQVQPFCTCYNDTGLFGVYVTANLDSYDDYSTLFQILQAPQQPTAPAPHTFGHAPRVPRGSCQSVDVKLRGAGSPLPEALSPCLCLTLPLPNPASALPHDELANLAAAALLDTLLGMSAADLLELQTKV